MKTLKTSIVIQEITIGLNSLNKKDDKFKKDGGEYHLNAVLSKQSEEFKQLYAYIKEILSKKKLTPKNIKKDKMPIKDGDLIFKELEQTDSEKVKGEWLKDNYLIKISTDREFKVFDVSGKELNNKDIAFTGANVEIHCTPYVYDNDFGKGVKILLHAIKIIQEGFGAHDDSREAFGFGDEIPTLDDDSDELPF